MFQKLFSNDDIVFVLRIYSGIDKQLNTCGHYWVGGDANFYNGVHVLPTHGSPCSKQCNG